MAPSPRWYPAVGFSLVAGAITARYVAKWKRSRSLGRELQAEQREPSSGRYYVGLDLTDPSARKPRPCDVAILDSSLRCTFSTWDYDDRGASIVPVSVLGRSFILAINGPQGLAKAKDATARQCERELNTQVKTPYALPAKFSPGFVEGSVKLFHRLVTTGGRFRLLGMDGVSSKDVNLLEVYPGSAWKVLSSKRLPAKTKEEGKQARRVLLEELGIQFLYSDPLNHDQLDAVIAAWTAYCFDRGLTASEGIPPKLDGPGSVLREGFIVQPALKPASLG
jgi:predicted nuclease with RNAse H fold